MFHGRDESWNLRDTHMFETLNELAASPRQRAPKVIMWAHNSHLGNARATEMSERGELNVGQRASGSAKKRCSSASARIPVR